MGRFALSAAEAASVDDALDALQLDPNDAFWNIIRKVEAVVGKRIEIYASGNGDWKETTSYVIDHEDRITVLVRHDDLLIYQVHGAFHEVGHILQGIPAGTEFGCTREFATPQERIAEEIAMALGKQVNLPGRHGELRAFG